MCSENFTEALAQTARDAKWTRALRSQARFKDGDKIEDGLDFVSSDFATTVGMMKDK